MYVTTKDIADTLGVTREYVTDKLTKRPDFPKPFVNKSQRLRRWKESDFRAWLQCPQPTLGSRRKEAA